LRVKRTFAENCPLPRAIGYIPIGGDELLAEYLHVAIGPARGSDAWAHLLLRRACSARCGSRIQLPAETAGLLHRLTRSNARAVWCQAAGGSRQDARRYRRRGDPAIGDLAFGRVR
jgi:hypothetical protein